MSGAAANDIHTDTQNIFAVRRIAAEEETLCTDGMLLFREDFGGNDPADPRVCQEPVSTMSRQYRQLLTDRFGQMGSGRYIVTKSGYCNGDTSATFSGYRASQWYLQDDHTYPGDYTRGYFLEVDGKADGEIFYSTTISDLCPNSTLSFSAYFANVELAAYYLGGRWNYAFPRLKFVLRAAGTDNVLAEYSTGDIPYDPVLQSNADWTKSSTWYHLGLNFTVPEGVDAVSMSIYNEVNQGGVGNDFAIDDIEIRLCLPPVTIEGPEEACYGSPFTMTALFTDDGSLTAPLEYRWLFSADSITWTEGGATQSLTLPAVTASDAGWYKALVSGAGNINRPNCRTESRPFRLNAVHCNTVPIAPDELCTEGVLLFREDFGGNHPADPRVGTTPIPGMTYTQLTSDNFGVMGSGRFLLTKKGYRNGSNNNYSQWHIQDDHTFPDDYGRGYFLEIDGEGNKNAAFYTTTISDLCPNSVLSFSAYVANVMTAGQYAAFVKRHTAYTFPQLRFVLVNPSNGETLASQSTDTISHDWSLYNVPSAWKLSSAWNKVGINFVVPKDVESIKLLIYNDASSYNAGNDFAMDDIEIRLCMPSADISSPPVVCKDSLYRFTVDFINDGTLAQPLEYKWFYSSDQQTWTERWNTQSPVIGAVAPEDAGWYRVYVSGAGNIDRPNCRTFSPDFRLDIEECLPPPPPPCPDIRFTEADTTVCDTLMPFTWRGVLFSEEREHRDTLRNEWGCDTEIFRFRLTTMHCEPPCESYSYTAVTVCREDMPYFWHGQSINHGGWLRDTLVNTRGCDSIITLTVNMKNCPPEECATTYGDTSATVCADKLPYIWHGLTLQNAGQATCTLTNAAGCDSIVTLKLNVEDCPAPPEPPIKCIPTTGDTAATICTNELPYLWHGQTLQNAGQATCTLTNAAGCDSIVTLTLHTEECEEICPAPTMHLHADTVCADHAFLPVHLRLTYGEAVRYAVYFNDAAHEQGFMDVPPTDFHEKDLNLPIPHGIQQTDYVRPDTYLLTIALEDTCGQWHTFENTFTVLYPSWVILQKWNDVLALYNERYNGGYTFSSIRWFHEKEIHKEEKPEEIIGIQTVEEEGRGEHHSYIYILPHLAYGEAYYAELTREDDGKTLCTCRLYPYEKDEQTIGKPENGNGERIRLTVHTESGHPVWKAESGLQGEYIVYDVLGRICGHGTFGPGLEELPLDIPDHAGTYIIVFNSANEYTEVKKISRG